MKSLLQKSPRSSGAFTLVEVVVSITVFGLMMVALGQFLNSAMAVTTGGIKHMNADTQARIVLDRISNDIARITKRADVDYYFQKNNGNDQMVFFSESSGYYPSGVTTTTPESTLSLVGYRINQYYQLERLSKALIWNGVTSSTSGASGLSSGTQPMIFLPQTIAQTWPNVEVSGAAQAGGTASDSDYQVIGDQVFRLEFCFLVQNSTTNATLSDVPYVTPNTSINGLQDVTAIVVSVAVLDNKSRMLLGNTAAAQASYLQTAAGNLTDDTASSSGGQTPMQVWQKTLNTPGTTLGLPKAAAAQVRVYQRYCYLTHVQ